MKSYLFKLSLGLLLFGIAGYSFAQNAANISFEKEKMKFNKVDEGTPVQLTYSFTYDGEFPLTLLPPEVDCTCTEVVLPKGDIEKDQTYTLVVKFDTRGKIGYQEREIKLKFISDAMDSRFIEKVIVFKGVVKASKETKEKFESN